jgi:hypothetical protein
MREPKTQKKDEVGFIFIFAKPFGYFLTFEQFYLGDICF